MNNNVCNLLGRLYLSGNFSIEEENEIIKNWDIINPKILSSLKEASIPQITGKPLKEFAVRIPLSYKNKKMIGKRFTVKFLPVLIPIKGVEYITKMEQENCSFLGEKGLELMANIHFNKIPKGKYLLFPNKGKSKIPYLYYSDGVVNKNTNLIRTTDLINPGYYVVTFTELND